MLQNTFVQHENNITYQEILTLLTDLSYLLWTEARPP